VPTTPIATFSVPRVDPVIDPQDASEIAVNLVASTTYPAGTILGERIGTDEVVTITIPTDNTGGSFTITFGAQTTTALNHNASAATVQAALEALSTIGIGNILVTMAAGVYTLVFRNALGSTNVGAVTTTPSLTGGTNTAAVSVVTAGVAGTQGLYGAYDSDNTNGTQFPKGILRHACVTDANGYVIHGDGTSAEWGQTSRSTDMWIKGTFRCEDLVGLDANAISLLGRLINGTPAHGRLMVHGS
jgi:hypothetical protein